MQKDLKKIIVIMSFIILSFVFIIGIPKPSDISNFPVPITAKVEKIYSEECIDYRYLGFNQLYLLRRTSPSFHSIHFCQWGIDTGSNIYMLAELNNISVSFYGKLT